MQSKYELTKLVKSWAVKMSASGRIMETFGTKAEASKAIKQYESGTRLAEAKPEVWVVGDYVAEAGFGGMQLGEATQLDLNQYKIVNNFTQEEFDALMEEYHEEEGYYPDT
jgi:hypothetical protein